MIYHSCLLFSIFCLNRISFIIIFWLIFTVWSFLFHTFLEWMILVRLNTFTFRISSLVWIDLTEWIWIYICKGVSHLWGVFLDWFLTECFFYFFHFSLFFGYELIILKWAITFRLYCFTSILVLWIIFNSCPRLDMKTILFILYTILVKTLFRNQILKSRIKLLSIRHH